MKTGETETWRVRETYTKRKRIFYLALHKGALGTMDSGPSETAAKWPKLAGPKLPKLLEEVNREGDAIGPQSLANCVGPQGLPFPLPALY